MNTSEQQFEVWWRIHNTPSMQHQKETFRKAFLAGYDYSALAGWALRTNNPILRKNV
jgi:hypothetical protein